mgnify:CR=1 FL=1
MNPYIIVMEATPGRLAFEVNRRAAEGYEPQGGIVFTNSAVNPWVQAMFKRAA